MLQSVHNGASLEYVVVNHLRDVINNDGTGSGASKDQVGSITGTTDDFNSQNMDSSNRVDGKIGKALDFNDGSVNDEQVCLENTGNLECNGNNGIFDTATNDRTVSLWYKADSVSGTTYRVLFDEGGAGNGQSIYIYDGKIYGCTHRSHDAACGNHDTTANEWHHVALVWNHGGGANTSFLYHDALAPDTDATFTGKDDVNSSNASGLGDVVSVSRAHNANSSVIK